MPNIDFMRSELRRLYPDNQIWARRVRKMKERQVMAIYFKSQEKLAELDNKKQDPPSNQDQIPF